MACALTQGYNIPCRSSLGGMKVAHIIEWSNVTATTIAAGVCTGITKATGKQFWKYSLIKQTGTFDETATVSEENGTVFYAQTCKFPLNTLQASVRNELQLMAQNQLIIVVIDNNGVGWLLGLTLSMNVKTIKSESGTKLGDRNGYALDFEGMEPTPMVQVDAATLLTLETPGA
jgi:hypothetical protein